MTPLPRRLRTRLYLSHVAVAAVGVLSMVIVGALVTRTVYERRLGGFGFGRGRGRTEPVSEGELRAALDDALVPALVAGAVAALAVAALVAWVMTRRLLRPLEQIGSATRRMAGGDYESSVSMPAEEELAELALDVNRLGHHLATIERRRSQLLGEVTHELRTPITLIRGRMEAVLDGVVEPGDELYLSVADEAARMQRLVDDLTLLSRADEGTLDIARTELDLADAAGRAAQRLRPQFEHAGVELMIAPGDRPLPVSGDDDRIVQIVTNLLGNALHHTPRGGTVTVRAGGDERWAWVDVIDTGSGIATDELDRIFERFYRGGESGSSTPSSAPGTRAGRGIGLTIARSLARAHGGEVVASSPGPGRGATFRLVVPRP